MKHLLLVLLLLSCAKHKPTTGVEIPQHLLDKATLYCELAYEHYKRDGYVHHKCDGVGFTSLYAKACPHLDIDLTKFEDSDGKLHRDPAHSCFALGESKAESSKDMTLMRMTAAWHLRDLGWTDRFINFAEKNNYQFCRGVDAATTVSTCILSYGLISLLYDMRSKLRNQPTKNLPEDSEREDLPRGLGLHETEDASPLDPIKKSLSYVGFRAHLAVLKIDLAGSIYGHISSSQKKLLKAFAAREPRNGLYQAAWAKWGEGDVEKVFAALSDETHFPSTKLPNNHDNHCTKYLYQRDELKEGAPNPDWQPCPSEAFSEHPGIEIPLTVSVLR